MRKKILFILPFLFFVINCIAQNAATDGNKETISMTQQLLAFLDISKLPEYLINTTVAQTSTYDITGGNNDGFNGTYSFIRKNSDSSLVIFDVKGPGVINRIWTPTPTDDTLDFFIDDTVHAAFSIKYNDLFSNKVFPFINPVCGNELGGYYCYLPIPFQTSCRIVCRALQTQFHQVQYRLYPPGTRVKKFTMDVGAEDRELLKKIAGVWNNETRGIKDFYQHENNITSHSQKINLLPGRAVTIFKAVQGGRVLAIKFAHADQFEGLDKNVDIKITWDDERMPAVYCPVADFFGYAFGKPSMQSLLLGTKNNINYCYLPMPFDKAATIELICRKNMADKNDPVQLSATVLYSNQKRVISKEGKFYARWNNNVLKAGEPAHVFLNTSGKGHYIGSMLLAQGMQPGMTYFFEGDDSTAIDGVFRIHGTGSEDYFNGGWYAFPDRWSKKMSLPLHGSLDYSLPFCRTGAYRFYITDKISFEKNIFQGIEHGPENNNVPVSYTSLGFYYCSIPPARILQPSNELSRVYIPDTMMLYPQLMNFTVWDNMACKATWKYNTGGESFNFSVTDESRLKISLDEIPSGRYQLYADLTNTEKGCSFSLWQGQQQVSEWIATGEQSKEERIPMRYCGAIAVGDFTRSLTARFKTEANKNSLLLNRLILVREKN